MTRKFYYRDELVKVNKMYGYHNRRISIYRLENSTGEPILIDRIDYQTGTPPTARQRVFNHLVDTGYIPKKYGHTDMYESGANKLYTLYELF